MLESPRRVAAIGSAAVICVLSLSGALGISPTGLGASGQHPATGVSGGDSAVGVDAGAGSGTAVKHTPHRSAGSHETATRHREQDVALTGNSGTGKRVVFDVSAQRVWLVNADDSVVRTYLVSGSKFDNLDNGTYQVSSSDPYATAYNSDETMRYMVRFAMGRTSPIGFHSIPAMPDGTLVEARSGLGAPASDGCIRQWITDARALYEFAPVGTTVVVRA